jgi:hypothetical protein
VWLTSDIVQHAQPQQRIGKTQDTSSDNRGPVRGLSIAGECKPEESDWEEPNCDEGDEKSGFGAVVAVDLAVSGVEPGLYGNEAEHYQDSDNEVKISEIS